MMRALSLALLVGCTGQTGTIVLGLATAPGSTVLAPVTRVRLTLTHPHAVYEATRGSSGFDLSIEVQATGETAELILEGFDAAGTLVATGSTPPFPVSSIDTKLVIYVAAPLSITAAPVMLARRRHDPTLAPLNYGAVIAGGREDSGLPSPAMSIYNTYNHTIAEGLDMPAPRAGIAVGAGINNRVFLFGGLDAAAQPTGTLWGFDTTVAPSGAYTALADDPTLARAGAQMINPGNDRFLITGSPVIQAQANVLTPRPDIAALPAAGAPVHTVDAIPTAVFADASGITWFRNDVFSVVSSEAHADASVTALPGGRALVVGGAAPSVLVDGVTGAVTSAPLALPSPCTHPAVAATARHLLVICDAAAEVFDATTLDHLATLPTTAASAAVPLPNGQILIDSGFDLQLFTPDPAL